MTMTMAMTTRNVESARVREIKSEQTKSERTKGNKKKPRGSGLPAVAAELDVRFTLDPGDG